VPALPAEECLFQKEKAEPVPRAYSFRRMRLEKAAQGLEREGAGW
jgi:hypothetical protein